MFMRWVVFTSLLFLHPLGTPAQAAQCDVTGEPAPLPAERLTRGLYADAPPPGPALRDPDMGWVTSTLASMSLEEKIGQMIMPGLNPGSFSISTVQSWIDNQHIGGIVHYGNGQAASDVLDASNLIQGLSEPPMLIAIDAEAGLGARVADATIFPMLMGFGAANDPALSEACGRITARECRALGVNVAFGPVVDVNTEPLNPIISTRSHSDDPARVESLAQGFITGARAEGLLCTFKHYPGHGATAGDSHSSLPVVDLPLSTLQAEHIMPYRNLATSGDVDLVMTAHVWFSQVDTGTPWPATLSTIFLTDILRTDIGYDGLIISDAYGMAGLAIAVPDERERAVLGVEAGLDVILMPPSVAEAHEGIRQAVIGGRLTEARIDESVERVLILKSRVGLPEASHVDPAIYPTVLRHPDHLATVRQVCEEALTLVRYRPAPWPPVTVSDNVLIVDLTASQRIFYRLSSSHFIDPFQARVPLTEVLDAGRPVSSSERTAILAAAPGKDLVIVIGRDWYHINTDSQVDLINELCAGSTPVIYVGFGAPYHLAQIPDVDGFFCGYSTVDAMQEVAVEVLLGDRLPLGDLPVGPTTVPVELSVLGTD